MKLLEPSHRTSLSNFDPILRWGTFLFLAAYLLFAHGCHGDEDTELFTRFAPQAAAKK